MRIVPLIVFYIATYVARIADGGETTRTMPGNGVKHILRQKSGAIRDEITEILIDDEVTTRETNKRRGQSFSINRFDGISQNRKILNGKLARVKRNLRKRKKRAKDSDIARHRNAFKNNDADDDIDEEEDTLSAKTRGLPIWQVSEPTVAAIDLNSTTNSMIVKTERINRTSFTFKRPPSRSGSLNSYRSSNEATSLIATDQQSNPHELLFDTNVPDKNLVFSKLQNSKSDVRSPVFKKLIDKIPLSAYSPKIPVDIDSPNSRPSRGFEWRRDGHRKDLLDSRNIKQDLPDDHLRDSNERFLLVPVSKDLYVLKNIQDSSETGTDGMIIPKRYKLLGRNKNEKNATSAIVSFKAHMHHDVKDVGRAYLHHRDSNNNHHLSDQDTNYLYTDLDSRILEENTENFTPFSYPNFLYPGIAFQTRPDLMDAVPKMLDQQITLRVPNKYISSVNIDSDTEVIPYDSSTFPSTSPFLDILRQNQNYDISSYPKQNNHQSNILPAIKLDKLNPRPESGNYKNSLEYSELNIESTTMDFQNIFGTLNDNTDASVTLKNAEMNDDKEQFDVSKNIEDDFKFSAFDASRINQDNSSFPNTGHFFHNNIKNISNNQDSNEDNVGSGISISSECSDKKSIYSNDFNYNNKFIYETLFNNYTTIKLDSFLNVEDYTTSASLLSDTDEWSSKKKQSNVGNPRALLKAIEPLSSELKKLLTAVKLVNQSISNVQNRLCDKKNVGRSERIERESEERSKDDFDLFRESFDNQSLDKKQIKIKGKNIADRTSNNVEFKRKLNDYFLNKLTTPLHKRESTVSSDREMRHNHRNFEKKKLNEREFPKSNNVERRRLSHLRFNRNLKSLTKNYEMQAKPIRQFVKSGLKRAIRTTTPVIISSHRLIENNVSSKNNFINGHRQDSREHKSISLSRRNTLSKFSDMSADKDNRVNFLSNNKRDLTTRYNATSKSSSEKENEYSSIDPQSYREATAYLDVLRLLNMTKKPYVERPTDILANVTESLISTTEFFVTTVTILPYPIERPMTTASGTTIAWRKEPPEVTESVLHEYLTSTDYEYYKYDEQNYTRIYEDQGDVASWYDYIKEITTEKKEISATTIKDLIPKFVETMRGVEITTPTKKKIEYEVVETISLARLSVTLSAFTITMPTTLPQIYTTELPILPINEITTEKTALTAAMLTEGIEPNITETSIVIPTTVKLTTESVMLLTPFLEGMTDITLRITVPAATSRTLIEETSMTEQEIVESTSTTEVTQSFPAETSISLYIISTVPSFTTAETAELTIQITTPAIPVLTSLIVAKKPRVTTPIEETISVTERMITVISPTIITTKSTAILGENTTLRRATTSKITYVTKIETEIEDVIPFATQALTFETHMPTSTAKITEETSLVAEKIKTTSIESTTTTEYTPITTLSTTRFAPTAQVTEGITETPITSVTSEITVVRYTITAITSSPTISERTETILSTSTKIVITTLTPEEESPVTQIEKTITTEEITTIETPTIIETSTTTKISIISETLTFNKTSTSSTTPTTIEVSSTTSTETLLTTIKTAITKILTPFEISTITDTLPIETRTITEPSTTTKIQTTIKTSIITETIESTSISSVMSVTVTAVKTIPTTLVTLITTKRPAITSVKTTVPTTPLKLTTTTPLSLVTNTTLRETPCTISTTFLTGEIETTTSSLTSITISTIKTLPTTLSTLITTTFLDTSVAINKTLFTTIFTTFKIATIKATTLPMTPITTTSPFKATACTTLTPSIVDTNTTLSEITFNTSSTEMAEETTSTTVSEIVSTTSLIELTTEERIATWITTEEITITEATTLITYVPLSTTMFSIETTAETTLFVIETVTAISSEEISTIEEVTAVSFTTITEESSLIKEITNVTSTTVGISMPTKITLTFTEKSTIPAIETSIANTSLASTIATTTVSLLREAATEITRTSVITTSATLLPITEEPEQIAILKTEMTFTPLPEFTLSILITSETSATTPEVISTLSKTISEEREFTTILTSPSITYTLESSILSIERTVQSTVSTLAATTTEMLEAETEYYIAKEPFYEEEYEEYEEYDTEIPTDKWYYYEESETTVKSRTTLASSTAKYTKLSKETATSPPFEGTSSYERKILEFTMYSTTSTSTYTDVILTATTTRIPYTYIEKEFTLTSALETSAMTIIENITTIEVGTVFITSVTSKEEESTTMALTFGSTEEYTLLPSTVFEIITKPLEYLTIPAKYTEPTSKFFTQRWYDVTAPKFITKPEEISEIELEKTSTSEEILTETEFTVEKLTSFFVSSTLTTLSEREAIGVHVTTASTAFSEMETAIEIAYETTTLATMLITKEEIAPYTTIVPELETEFITTRQTTIGREEQRKQLLQLCDDLEQREREVAEREERLKEKELQWEEKKLKEMMQHEKEKNITIVSGTTASYVTTTIIDTVTTPVVSTQNLTVAPTEEIKITSLVLDTSSLAEIITTSTETTPLYITEESIFATYATEKTEETTKESTFPTYIVEVTEETAILYTTEESTSVTYITKEAEEIYITNYTTLTSYVATSIVDLYNISLVSIETTASYTTEEMYTTSYGTAYLSEPLLTSPTMVFTSPITLAIDEFTTLPTATFNISSYEIGATSIAIPTRITKERYTTSYVTLCSVFPLTSSTMTLTNRITSAIDITASPISVTIPILYATEKTIDIYSESSFTSPALAFIKTTTALAISTIKEMEYDEEIESLKEELREKERELEKREKMLLEREESLEKNITEFELYMKQLEEEEMRALSEKPIVPTSLSTPVPPTENTAINAQITTQIKKVTEKKEDQTTTKMVTSQRKTTKVKDVEEKERTRHVPEKITTHVEEEIVTRRICLNVLENTTIPFATKKVCLPYFPEKNREQNYNKDRETHEVISAKPNEDELTVIISDSNDDNKVTKFEKDDKITTPHNELEEKNDLQEGDDLQEEDKLEEDDFED
ncbi:melanoma-associated antigen e1, partial [Lasius niger]